MIRMKPSLLTVLLLLVPIISGATEPRVVASIMPVHSLVAGVMQGVGEPQLIIKGATSPHDYSLRPSDVRLIHQSQVVFWVGEGLETVLRRPLANATARSVELMEETPGLKLLSIREGGAWESHVHYHHGDYNAHIWLDPHNAIAMVRHISVVLSEVDPAHQPQYKKNSADLIQRLKALDQELARELAPIKDAPYFVFHDAYQYFEQRYGVNAVGSIVVSPERLPGTRRVREIRDRVRGDQVHCVFSEPQFEPALVETLIEGTDARRGELDPLGAGLSPGPDAYFHLLRGLVNSLRDCLF